MPFTKNKRSQSAIDLLASFAALDQRVEGLEEEGRDTRHAVSALEQKMEAGFAALGQKFDLRSQTPWVVIISGLAVILTGVTTVGWLARQPLADGIQANKLAISRTADQRMTEDRRIEDRILLSERDLNYIHGFLDGRATTQELFRHGSGITTPSQRPAPLEDSSRGN